MKNPFDDLDPDPGNHVALISGGGRQCSRGTPLDH
jgi:hypothetical protein